MGDDRMSNRRGVPRPGVVDPRLAAAEPVAQRIVAAVSRHDLDRAWRLAAAVPPERAAAVMVLLARGVAVASALAAGGGAR